MDFTEEEKKKRLKSEETRVATIETRLENSPTAEDFFVGFLPAAVSKATTDADGRFSLAYPRNKPYAIFASATRQILNATERYYWLLDAPTDMASAQIFLSSKNLVYVDPDGYFKMKPLRSLY